MEKRVDRNKKLYAEIDKIIEEKRRNVDNSSFDNTKSTLSSINPDLFGESKPKNEIEKETKKHNFIIPIIFGIIAVIGLVVFIIWKTKD